MKSAHRLVGLAWLSCTTAAAQPSPQTCPALPASSGLQWSQQTGDDHRVCKASDGDGRQLIGLMLTSRDPDIAFARNRRAEQGEIDGNPMYWYRLDLGGREIPGMESRRIAVVKLGKQRYAQIWIDAANRSELVSMQSLVQQLNLQPASVALQR